MKKNMYSKTWNDDAEQEKQNLFSLSFSLTSLGKRPNPLDDDVMPCCTCWFCMVLQSTKVNNNTAHEVIIEWIRPFFLSLLIEPAHHPCPCLDSVIRTFVFEHIFILKLSFSLSCEIEMTRNAFTDQVSNRIGVWGGAGGAGGVYWVGRPLVPKVL